MEMAGAGLKGAGRSLRRLTMRVMPRKGGEKKQQTVGEVRKGFGKKFGRGSSAVSPGGSGEKTGFSQRQIELDGTDHLELPEAGRAAAASGEGEAVPQPRRQVLLARMCCGGA